MSETKFGIKRAMRTRDRHNNLIQLIKNKHIGKTDIRMITYLYFNPIASVKISN